MIALSLYLPEFPSDVARKRARLDPRVPIILARDEHQREVVAACCGKARRAGVAVGMTVSQAKALLPSSVHQDGWDASVLARALRGLAHHALRFTPLVMPDQDGLWLDCAGCEHLFGGMGRMAGCIARYFTRMGFACRVGVAPSMGAAWAMARHASDAMTIVEREDVGKKLEPLPIEALRLRPEEIEGLWAVGVTRVGELLKIPRASVAERFGGTIARRIDQALGREGEVFEPVRSRPRLHLGQAFAGPTDRPESIAMCVRKLLEALSVKLARREAGCRELVLILRRSDLPAAEITARASVPSRNAEHWYTLLRPKLERAHLGYGVEGVEVMARGVVVLVHTQTTRWLDTRDRTNLDEVARLADTLKARLGEQRVLRMHPRASHTPECSWSPMEAGTFDSEPDATPVPALDRPTRLLPQPLPVAAMFLFPDGPIGSLTVGGVVRRIVRCRGPERVCGEWWHGLATSRDYYQVQESDGAWLWVFRAVESGRWFLHGEWA